MDKETGDSSDNCAGFSRFSVKRPSGTGKWRANWGDQGVFPVNVFLDTLPPLPPGHGHTPSCRPCWGSDEDTLTTQARNQDHIIPNFCNAVYLTITSGQVSFTSSLPHCATSLCVPVIIGVVVGVGMGFGVDMG